MDHVESSSRPPNDSWIPSAAPKRPVTLGMGPYLETARKRIKFDDVPVTPKDIVSKARDLSQRVIKHFTLSYRPKIEITVTLHGEDPEARITAEKTSFVLSYDEIITMHENIGKLASPDSSVVLSTNFNDDVCPEGCSVDSSAEGLCFIRYAITQACPLNFDDVTTKKMLLNCYARKKLVSSMNDIVNHVNLLLESKDAIKVMFQALCNNYAEQYHIASLILPVGSVFEDLVRIVGSYVPTSKVIREFSTYLEKNNLTCRLTHFTLYSVVSVQYDHIRELLNDKI